MAIKEVTMYVAICDACGAEAVSEEYWTFESSTDAEDVAIDQLDWERSTTGLLWCVNCASAYERRYEQG